MERIALWMFLTIGIILMFIGFRKPLTKEAILVFFMKAYFSTFIGVIVVEEKLLTYPVSFLSGYFDTSILFEYLLYPIVCTFYYRTSHDSTFFGIVMQAVLYSTAITIIEVILEKYTDLIDYHTWTWYYTFVSIFLLSLFVRILMLLINKAEITASYKK